MSQVHICSRSTKSLSGPVCVPGAEDELYVHSYSQTEYLLPRTSTPTRTSHPRVQQTFSDFLLFFSSFSSLFQHHVPRTLPASLYTFTLHKIFASPRSDLYVMSGLGLLSQCLIHPAQPCYPVWTLAPCLSLSLVPTASVFRNRAREPSDAGCYLSTHPRMKQRLPFCHI